MMRKPQINKVKNLWKKENGPKRKMWRLKKLLLVRDVRGCMLQTIYWLLKSFGNENDFDISYTSVGNPNLDAAELTIPLYIALTELNHWHFTKLSALLVEQLAKTSMFVYKNTIFQKDLVKCRCQNLLYPGCVRLMCVFRVQRQQV